MKQYQPAIVHKTFLISGAVLGMVAVMLGAFGAHALTPHLSETSTQTFQTANRYHFYHVFALLIVGLLQMRNSNKLLLWSGYAFLIGILLFSGSLYLLSTKTILGIEHWNFLGPMTPLGGLFFIVGWVLLAIAAMKS